MKHDYGRLRVACSVLHYKKNDAGEVVLAPSCYKCHRCRKWIAWDKQNEECESQPTIIESAP